LDIDSEKIERLSRGEVPIYEPGLEDLVKRNLKAGRLSFSTRVEKGVRFADIIFIAVGTPESPNGEPDMSAVYEVVEKIAYFMTAPKIIVLKSTVPIGTHKKVERIMKEITRHSFVVVSNPEFLKEGNAVNDFMRPERVIIGTDDLEARRILTRLYTPMMRREQRIIFMSPSGAELTKYAANAFLAMRISFINEMANLCEALNIDISEIQRGIGSDSRIGKKYLFAGVGYGGSCFPKDMKALLRMASKNEVNLNIIEAVDKVNLRQRLKIFDKIYSHFKGELKGKTIAIWGLSFKPQTDDIREAPAIITIERLIQLGCYIQAYDPIAGKNTKQVFKEKIKICKSSYSALLNADCLALFTEWQEFRSPDFSEIRKLLKEPIIFDGRNLYQEAELRKQGFIYYGIGI
jgi:UDPglucose 6-dehydrogenase